MTYVPHGRWAISTPTRMGCDVGGDGSGGFGMELSWQIVIVGTALGILQLAVGVFVGRLLPVGRKGPVQPDLLPTDPDAPTIIRGSCRRGPTSCSGW